MSRGGKNPELKLRKSCLGGFLRLSLLFAAALLLTGCRDKAAVPPGKSAAEGEALAESAAGGAGTAEGAASGQDFGKDAESTGDYEGCSGDWTQGGAPAGPGKAAGEAAPAGPGKAEGEEAPAGSGKAAGEAAPAGPEKAEGEEAPAGSGKAAGETVSAGPGKDGDDMTEEQLQDAVYRRYYEPYEDEEELIAALELRGPYYKKCSFSGQVQDYLEKVRGVTDVANLVEPLFHTDMRFYSAGDFEDCAPLILRLARNEIYARRGYIFKDEDMYNYFYGHLWYEPTVSPGEFDDSVFNEYESANLELLILLESGSSSAR